MKRISDFVDCRMDMKKMAALNGGAATGYSYIAGLTSEGCGDTDITTVTDDFTNGILTNIGSETKRVYAQCPEKC